MTVAFVLAGGGSLAATHVGMLRALSESGIEPDLVVGTSAGAINAFQYAADPTDNGLTRLCQLWHGLRRKDVFPINARDIVAGLIGKRDGFVSPDRLRAFLLDQVGDVRLEDAKIPVHIVATDLAEGEPVVLSAGPAIPALLASAAMPGVFPPVVLDGRSLIDGAVTADTPIRQAESLGATEIYVLPTVGPKTPRQLPRGAVAVMIRAIDHMFGHVVSTDIASARASVTVLPAPPTTALSPFDFRSTDRMIDESYAMNLAALGHPVEPADEPAASHGLRLPRFVTDAALRIRRPATVVPELS
ncbi:MAG TPA: patatin-like phospholipase family protein [Pseudonocardiaceae bacterium]|nr:patatin-like phospholipase family protein [Pseudonocardiaceae bacterium]